MGITFAGLTRDSPPSPADDRQPARSPGIEGGSEGPPHERPSAVRPRLAVVLLARRDPPGDLPVVGACGVARSGRAGPRRTGGAATIRPRHMAVVRGDGPARR